MDKSTIEDLRKDLQMHEEKANAIRIILGSSDNDLSILSNGDTSNNLKPAGNGYYKEGTLKKKVIFIFKEQNRFLHCREVADMIIKREPDIKDQGNLVGRVSAIMSRWNKDTDSNLAKITIGSQLRNTFWGSKSWLDEEGKVKSDHRYDQNYVYKDEKETIKL